MDRASIRLKRERAREHRKTIDAVDAALRKPDGYTVERVLRKETREHIYRLRILKKPDETIATVIGDCLFDYRCALDHLMAAMVFKSGGRPSGSKYPIAKRRQDLEPRLASMGTLPARVRTLIKWSQPYRRGENAGRHVLQLLDSVHQVDKHQRLHVTALAPSSAAITNVPDFSDPTHPNHRILIRFANPPLKDGAKLLLIKFPAPAPEVDMKVTVELHLAFASDPVRNMHVMVLLDAVDDALERLINIAERYEFI